MPNITIIGAGFAALTAVRRIRRKAPNAKITLIAQAAEFVYYPGLIWLPSGIRTAGDLRIPLQAFFAKYDVHHHAGMVTGLKDSGRVVNTTHGQVHNDALLIASGGRFIKTLPGIEHVIALCEGIPAAEAITQKLAKLEGGIVAVGFGTNPKEPSAMRGGPMFELLFGIDTLLRRQGRRERFELVFFNPAAQPGKRLGERAVSGLLREMRKRGITTHLGHKILGFEHNAVKTAGGDFNADLILFMPGMTGPAWVNNSGLQLSDGGLIKANKHCQVPDTQHVYVAGDSGSYPGPDWLPKQAHMADLQAITAVDNMLASLSAKPAKTAFQPAAFKPELVCIVDTLDKGVLVYRNERRTLVVSSKLLHWVKRLFERLYLRHIKVSLKSFTRGATVSTR